VQFGLELGELSFVEDTLKYDFLFTDSYLGIASIFTGVTRTTCTISNRTHHTIDMPGYGAGDFD
jgi:hypothetical protein